jgi:hypothetical protein
MGKAGRKNKYETHVKPYLEKIPNWYLTKTEAQIAKKLGISEASWTNYKKQYPELQECLKSSQADLVDELKGILKKKAQGFYYTEKTKTVIKEGGKECKKIEEKEKYAQPDTGAIHLLLKNLDPDWHNDDKQTMELKRRQTEIMQQRTDQAEW